MLEEGDLLVCGEVLVTEEHDAALGDEESQFIFLLRGELGQLNAFEERADGFGEVAAFGGRQECLLCWVREGGAVLVRSERLSDRIWWCPVLDLGVEILESLISRGLG